MILFLLACAGQTPADDSGPVEADTDTDADSDTDTDADTDTDTDTDTDECVYEEPEPPAERDLGGSPTAARTLSGQVVWTLEFDADAEAAGYTDCTYTREYAENLETNDQGYLCPDCTLLTTGTAVMTVGYEDCYLQISDTDADRIEHLGIGTVDGEEHLFRGVYENLRLTDQGAVTGSGPYAVEWTDESELDAGGTMFLSAVGELAVGTREDVMLDDIAGARAEPYTCGWPQNSPGGPNVSWDVADGEIFPNIRLTDQCGEAVDLWDFRGYYVVLDSSSPNCGPCQSMASGAEDFKAAMEAACVPVELVTLLNESLSAVNQPASGDAILDWVDEFGLTSPVLADRGAGYALMPDYLGVEDGMSYPGIIVLDPEGRVIWGDTGFGSWDTIESVILEDAGG